LLIESILQALVALIALLAFREPQAPVPVVMQTDLGEIEIEIGSAHAPVTAADFLKYVDAGLYAGRLFHRTVRPDNQREKPVKIAVIQGAANAGRKREFFSPIALERTNKTGLAHKDGTISMARDGPDTATDEFFICVGDQPELDFGGKRNPTVRALPRLAVSCAAWTSSAAFRNHRPGSKRCGRRSKSSACGGRPARSDRINYQCLQDLPA
jgi:cyclophilin family peptidyl-prolyl cis-trans isomerase